MSNTITVRGVTYELTPTLRPGYFRIRSWKTGVWTRAYERARAVAILEGMR